MREQIGTVGLRFALYRLHDAEGRLLYVGVTDNLKTRFSTHATAKSWWPSVARKAVTWYDTRTAALAAEAAAIRAESPLHNVVYGTAAPGASRSGLHTRIQTAFRLDPTLLAKLKAQADDDGCTMTDVVHAALTSYLDQRANNDGGYTD